MVTTREVDHRRRYDGRDDWEVQLDPPMLVLDQQWRWCGVYRICVSYYMARIGTALSVSWYMHGAHDGIYHPVTRAIIDATNLDALTQILIPSLLLGISPPLEAYDHLTIGGNDGATSS